MKGNRSVAEGKESSMAGARSIMVVDDHPLVREGIVALIQGVPDLRVSAEVGSTEEAAVALAREIPDLILLDISFPSPGKDGIEFLKELHVDYPKVRVLIVSMWDESVYAERALRAGAHGYIMKHEPGVKVIEAVQCVLRGELYVSSFVAAHILKRYVSSNKQVMDPRIGVEKLSDRELQVFIAMGKGMSVQEIADTYCLSAKTIQTYREHIKRKLGLRSANEVTVQAAHWMATNAGGDSSSPDGERGGAEKR